MNTPTTLDRITMMLIDECMETLENALKESENDRIYQDDFPHEVRTCTLAMMMGHHQDRIREILIRCKEGKAT